MEITCNGGQVQTSEMKGKTRGFDIQAKKTMFRMLSSGIYSDKILAIIRELGCNAFDSHIAAGKRDVPFDIELPTEFTAEFVVRDSGIGLTEEQVYDLYCTYGSSTKNNTNEQVGMFGIGSKSPFAYQNGFSVNSNYDGTKYMFSMTLTDEGPTVTLVDKIPTDEPNGLEVRVPVEIEDICEFESKIRIALEFFNPLPNLNTPVDIVQPTYLISGSNWGIRKYVHTHQGSKLRAIQGMVAYSVGNIDSSKLSVEQRRIIQMPLDITVPIGTLNPAASRETLELDTRTVQNIKDALDKVYEEMMTSITTEIGKCTTSWEGRLKIFEMINSDGGLGGFVNEALNAGKLFITYPSFSLEGKEPKINELDYHSAMLCRFSTNSRSKHRARKSDVFKKNVAHTEWVKETMASLVGTKTRESVATELEVRDGIAFVINDLAPRERSEKYMHFWLQEWVDNKGANQATYPPKSAYLLTPRDKKTDRSQFHKECNSIIGKLGNPTVYYLSALKAVFPDLNAKTPAAKHAREVRKALKLKSSVGTSWRHMVWEKADPTMLPSGIKFYVPLDNLRPADQQLRHHFEKTDRFMEFCKAVRQSNSFGLTPATPIYGLRATSPLRKKADWVNLFDHVFDGLKTVMTPAKEMELSLKLRPFRFDLASMAAALHQNPSLLAADSPIGQFCHTWYEAEKAMKANETVNAALATVSKFAQTLLRHKVGTVADFGEMWEEVKGKYSLLGHLRFYEFKGRIVMDVLNYCRMVDVQRREEEITVTNVAVATEEELVNA